MGPISYTDPIARQIRGCEKPRIYTQPLRPLTEETTLGFNAIAFAEVILGLTLLPWQKWLLIHIFELLPEGNLRFRTVIIEVARQNGKSLIAQVICLYRLFVDDTRMVLGTAQNLDVAREVWMDAVSLVDGSELASKIDGITTGNGKEQLKVVVRVPDPSHPGEYKNQVRRWKVAAANRKGGRGLSIDTVLMDELREQENWDAWSAIKDTTMARDNGMVIGISNAGDDKSVVLKDRREEAIAEIDAGTDIAIFEWSAPADCDLDDVTAWAQANPSLGYTVSLDAMINARRDPEPKFRTENLCQWVTTTVESYFDFEAWQVLEDSLSQVDSSSEVKVAVDVSADRKRSYVSVAGWRSDGLMHVETIAAREGMFWVVPYVQKVLDALGSSEVVIQARGCPASELIQPFERDEIEVRKLGGSELGFATGQFSDRIRYGSLRHLIQPPVDLGVEGAIAKKLGNLKVLDRDSSITDVAPVIAETYAAYALTNDPPEAEAPPAPEAGVLEDTTGTDWAEQNLATVAF